MGAGRHWLGLIDGPVDLGAIVDVQNTLYLQGVPYHWAHFVFVIFSGSRAYTEELFSFKWGLFSLILPHAHDAAFCQKIGISMKLFHQKENLTKKLILSKRLHRGTNLKKRDPT